MTTIKEIAKLCGVSPMTVSNVINKKYHKVSKQTIENVEKIMEELNYVPNLSARSLVSKNSNIIVLIIPQSLDDDPDKDYAMHNPFYGEFINSIEYNLRQRGYYMMLRFVSEDEVYYPSLKLWNADGVIVLGADQVQFDLNLADLDISLVMVDSYIDNEKDYCTVVSNDKMGGALAAGYLLDRGCTKLGVICTDISVQGVSQERYNGFIEYLADKKLDLDTKDVFQGFPSYDYGLQIADEIAKHKLDGVFAFSDMVALGIIEGLKKLEINVPEDVSVIGFDGLFVGEISSPKLTTIKQNIYEKGEKTVELLIQALNEKDYHDNIVLPVLLEVKESVI
jgi:LacI family transcriptional regulator